MLSSSQLDLDMICVFRRVTLKLSRPPFAPVSHSMLEFKILSFCDEMERTVLLIFSPSKMKENKLSARGGNLARIPVLCT